MITPDIIASNPAKLHKRALILACLMALIFLIALIVVIYKMTSSPKQLTAYIYQNGELIKTIDLGNVTSAYTFTIKTADGGFNEISVRPGAIGICDANCPDRLCVSMGYADSSILPIVCLPHNLVIQVKESSQDALDVMTY